MKNQILNEQTRNIALVSGVLVISGKLLNNTFVLNWVLLKDWAIVTFAIWMINAYMPQMLPGFNFGASSALGFAAVT